MMRIEQTIRRIESMQTCQQLEAYLTEAGYSKPYNWCCLLIQRNDLQCLGDIPDSASSKIKALNLRRLNTDQYKPQWFDTEDLFPAHSIFIPQKAQGTDCVALLLGIEPDLAPEFIEKLTWYWQILATYIYDAYRRCHPDLSPQHLLTKRELECLHWIAQGKTSWEIGLILGISERTVNFHIGNSIEKTGCVNRQQLVSKCLNIA